MFEKPHVSKENKTTVAILMSTYNGEKYIKEQIESILSQLGPEDQIIIRDDGSSDMTLESLKSYNDSRIEILTGVNIGFAKSFFHILYHVSLRHSIYMLADQDDVWMPGKIDRARRALTSKNEPHLYCTRLNLVNERLSIIGQSPRIRKQPDFRNAICENIATGCTIALNNSAMRFIRKIPITTINNSELHYHDWWLYLNISYFGKVIWDPEPSIFYRQHGDNSVGMGNGLNRYKKIWKSVRKKSWVRILIIQLRIFLNVHQNSLSLSDREWITSLCKGSPSQITWNLIKDKKLHRQQPIDKYLFIALVIFDYFRGQLRALPTENSHS